MEGQDLIAETNALLRQILERDDERKKEAAEARAQFESQMKERPMSEPEPTVEDDFQKRMAAAQEQSKQRLEEMRVKDLEYKDLMLNEVKEQTRLLRAIREKLEA